MSMTMTQKILAAHAGLLEVSAGQLIKAKLDLVLANDITGPVAINEFDKAGFSRINRQSRIALIMDHFAPNKDIKSAEGCKKCRSFAKRFDLDHFYDVGEMGIEHALIPEKGLIAPGEAAIGADSHTCTMVRWALFPPESAQPIWRRQWQQAKHGLRFLTQSR